MDNKEEKELDIKQQEEQANMEQDKKDIEDVIKLLNEQFAALKAEGALKSKDE